MDLFGATDWAGIFAPDQSLLESFVRGSVVYLSVIALFRIAMRRQGGSIGLPDIMLVVLVSECVSASLSAEAKSVPNGLAAVAALLFWSFLFDRLGHRWPWFQRLLEPAPLTLVRDGRMLRKHLDREGITDEELNAQLRLNGVEDVSRVKLATLEADGDVSVVPQEERERQDDSITCPAASDLDGALKHFLMAANQLQTAIVRHEERAADHKAAAKSARELLASHGVRPGKVVSHSESSPALEKSR